MADVTRRYSHVYYERWKCWDGCPAGEHDCYEIRACPVTRITPKRIYFRGADNGALYMRQTEYFVDRAAIESDSQGTWSE